MILRSLTSRLIFLYCVILLLLGAAFLAFTVLSFQHYAREVLTTILENRTQDIWRLSRESVNQPAHLAALIEKTYSPSIQNRFIRVRLNGHPIYWSQDPASGEFSSKAVPLLPASDTGQIHSAGDVIFYSRSYREPGKPEAIVETGQFQYSQVVQDQLTKSLFVGLPLLLLMAAIAGYFIMRRALTPVESMIRAAEAYTFNEPHKRLPTLGSEPRIEALGLALNRMLDRLDSAYSHVSRFTSDAAHELRTPLTIIRGELELIMRRENLPGDVEEALKTALEEVTRLSSLVDSLITLSRMDSLWGKAAHDRVDLMSLAKETIEQMHLLLEEKDIKVSAPNGPPITVLGDRGRLKQVLVNLLDNAIKYTPTKGAVAVRVFSEGTMAVVIIEDSGIGIDPAHLNRVFDRFYRVSPDRGTIGAGLGLAIVKSICQAHGGTVFVRSVPLIGSSFIVELPLASATNSDRTPLEFRKHALEEV